MSEKPRHAPITEFAVVDDCLLIGGLRVPDLARRVGQTPFYAYDRAAISRRVAALRGAMPDGISLHYAMKANPMPAVVQHLSTLVDGLDVASGRELRVALDTGMAPGEISFAGPGKQDWELETAIAAEITLNVESEGELARIVSLGERLGITPRVAVRVNPQFELKASGMKMTGRASQFGIDEERVPAALARIGETGLDFRGLHIYSGSQNLNAANLIEAQDRSLELACRLANAAPAPIRVLNIGGGFGIPYFPGDQPLDLAPIAENLAKRLPDLHERLPEAEVVIELGRYLVGEAGVYVCRVIDRKISRGQVFLVTDGGLHHHLAASGNFGQVIRKNYPVVVADRIAGGARETASVVGPLCTPLDLLADRMELAHAEPGDLICVLCSGAYGPSASPAAFLSHPAATEVLV